MKALLARYGVGSLGAAVTAISIALFVRGAIVALYLVAITRWLGVQNYGVFASAITASAILAPVAGWGAAQLLMQRVSARPGLLAAELRAAIWQLTSVGIVLIAMSLLIARLLDVDMSAATLLVVSASELVLLPLTLLVATACQAVGNTRLAAAAICLSPAMRLLLLGGVVVAGTTGTTATAAVVHLLGTLLATIISIRMLRPAAANAPAATFVRPYARLARVVRGTRYALGNAAATLYLEIDKLLIIALVGSGSLGSYVVAFRVATLAGMPVAGLSSVVLPRLFASRGPAQRAAVERAMLVAGAIYGAVASLVMVLVSPWLPLVFGEDFGEASRYLLLLSPWPLLYACKMALATQLTGAGEQGVRTIIETGGLVVAALAGWGMIASRGPDGAAIALLVAEAAMVAAMLARRRRSGSKRSAGNDE